MINSEKPKLLHDY